MRARLRSSLSQMSGSDGSVNLAAIGTLGASLAGTAIRFALQIVLANWLTQAAYGLFIVARSWGELLAKIPSRGYKLSALRHLPAYETEQDWPHYRGFVQRSSVETLLLGIAIASLASGTYVIGADEFDWVYIVGFFLAPALAMVSLWRSLLQAAHRYVPAFSLTEIVQPLLFAAALAATASLEPTPTLALAMWTLSVAAVAVVEYCGLRRWMPGPRSVRPSHADRRTWTTSARTDFVAQIGIAALQVIDVIVIGWTLGPTEAALYGVATRIAVLGRIVNSGLESVVSPRITAAYKRGEIEEIQKIVDQTIRVSFGPTVAFAVAVAFAANPILRVFDETYTEARSVLLILLIGNVVNALSGPSGFVTAMTGGERSYAWVMSGHAIALAAGAYFVGGPWGIVGVAVIRAGVNVSWNVILAVLAARRLSVKCYPRPATLRA
ncbi:MAG: lipopolysaccharide biosynthesis protein [Acidimicrobiales bacterium]